MDVHFTSRNHLDHTVSALAGTAVREYQALRPHGVVLAGSLAIALQLGTSAGRVPDDIDWQFIGPSKSGRVIQRAFARAGLNPQCDRSSGAAWMGAIDGDKTDLVPSPIPLTDTDIQERAGLPVLSKDALLAQKMYARSVSMDMKHDYDIAALMRASSQPVADYERAASRLLDVELNPPVIDRPSLKVDLMMDPLMASRDIEVVGYRPYGAVRSEIGEIYDDHSTSRMRA